MNSLFRAKESSISTTKKIGIMIVAVALFGFGVWAGMEMAGRLASGR